MTHLKNLEKEELQHFLAAQKQSGLIQSKDGIRWGSILLASLLIHGLFLSLKTNYSTHFTPPIAIDSINPSQLEAIKNQWKEKSFLLSKDSTPKTDLPPPSDARYESDRNRRVEKEQKAAQTQVLPRSARQAVQPAIRQQTSSPPSLSQLSNLDGYLKQQSLTPPSPSLLSPSEAGGDQALLENNLPTGAENLLNTQESKYYSFYSRIYEAIGPLWQSKIRSWIGKIRVPTGDYLTQAEIILDHEGNYLETHILKSSGIQVFDQAIHEAWSKTRQFPNPPKGLLDSNGLLRMTWTFSVRVDSQSGFQYVPPERVITE